MNIKFQKYQGAGNDFIIIDNRYIQNDLSTGAIQQLCDRKFGIGADGLMLLENCKGYDFRMRYFNADGREATLCGNGSRCIVAFAHRLGLFRQTTRFMAVDGEHEGEITESGVRIRMSNVNQIQISPSFFFLNTGSPHYVKVVPDAFKTDVFHDGQAIRYAAPFQPEGTNVNFMTLLPEGIQVATYERGVENETLSCGTGCVACALCAAILKGDLSNTYLIQTKGGNLKVSFERNETNHFTQIWLEGPATYVFSGETEIKTE